MFESACAMSFVKVSPRAQSGFLAAALSLSNVARILSILVVTILLGRTRGPSDLGDFSVLLAAVAVLQSISIGGLSGAAVRKLIEGGEQRGASIAVIIAARLILIVPSFTIGFILVLTIVGLHQTHFLALTIFFICYAIGTFDVPEIIWMGRGGFKVVAGRRLIVVSLMLPPKLAAAAFGNFELVLIFQGLEAALWQGALLNRSGLGSASLRSAIKSLRAGIKQLNELRNLWLSSIAAVVSARADVFIVAALLGSAIVGQYATASRFVEAATILAVAITSVFFNDLVKVSSDSAKYAQECARASRVVFGFGFLVFAALFTIGPAMIIFLYGSEFRSASEMLPAYSIVIVFIFQRQLLSKVLIIERAYGYSLVSNLTSLGINVGMNIVLVSTIGVWGAILAAVLSNALSICCTFFPTQRGRDMLMISMGSIFMPKSMVERSSGRLKNMRKVSEND